MARGGPPSSFRMARLRRQRRREDAEHPLCRQQRHVAVEALEVLRERGQLLPDKVRERLLLHAQAFERSRVGVLQEDVVYERCEKLRQGETETRATGGRGERERSGSDACG